MVASSEEQLASHRDGKRHQKHLAMAEVAAGAKSGAAAPEEETGSLHCDLCDVTAPSATHKQLHLMCGLVLPLLQCSPGPAFALKFYPHFSS